LPDGIDAVTVELMKGENHQRTDIREEVASCMRGFLHAELELARTFLSMAITSSIPSNKARHLENAWKAYSAVLSFARRTPLASIEADQIASDLDSLKVSLLGLTETATLHASWPRTEGPQRRLSKLQRQEEVQAVPDLADQIERFNQNCGEVYGAAVHMLSQNQALMRRMLVRG